MSTLAGELMTTLWNSTAFHVTLSLILHGIGVSLGLFIWYLFPQDPAKVVIRQPVPRYSLSVSAGMKSDKRLTTALLLSSGESSEDEELHFSDEEQTHTVPDIETAIAAPSADAKKLHNQRGHG